ncbi:MAG: hypothetical protein V1725_00140 [archaeon]
MKNIMLYAGLVLLLFAGLFVAGAFASSSTGMADTATVQRGPLFKNGEHAMLENDATRTALANADYTAYLSALDESWAAYRSTITEEKFNALATQYQKREQQMTAMQDHQQAVHAAMDAGDYAAWKAAMESSPRNAELDVITADNFDTFVAMHEAMQDGDVDTARALADEMGILPSVGSFGKGFDEHAGQGFGKGHGLRI